MLHDSAKFMLIQIAQKFKMNVICLKFLFGKFKTIKKNCKQVNEQYFLYNKFIEASKGPPVFEAGFLEIFYFFGIILH